MFKVIADCCQSWAAPSGCRLPFALLPLGLALSTAAQDADSPSSRPIDKGQFSIVNPTPRKHLREMSTDRPDVTESAYSVDAGHFQAELSFLQYSRDSADGGVDQFAVMPMNLKLGLLNQVDLQLVIDPYVRVETDDETIDGFGDLQVRTKVNLWGNDSGPTALALMPFIQFPTAPEELGSEHVEGGLIVPFAAELPAGWSLGLMAELDVVRDEANDGYGVELLHTVAFGHDIAGPLAGYVEYIGVAPHRTGAGYQAAIGFGLTYGISEDVQLDGGANVGISRDADDVVVFAGMSFRL
jgi:hypothetical protein